MNPLESNKNPEIVSNEQAEVVTKKKKVVAAKKIDDKTESISTSEKSVEQPQSVSKTTDYNLKTKAELIDALKSFIEKEVDAVKEEVELIKQTFYKKAKAEVDEKKRLFIEDGGEDGDFKSEKDELEETLKSLLVEYRTRKSAYIAQLEKEKENNLLQKQHILEQMKSLTETNDDVSSHINEFRELQQKWKTIGQVSAQHATDLWKEYNSNQEAFWDLVKINNELREYDFKKNLEAKTLICEAAKRLAADENIVEAFKQLQKLHEEWHELGPVARELREDIWNSFKEASSIINKKHHAYFDTLRKVEVGNMEAKVALCEKAEAFDFSGLNNYKAWDDATQTVLAWQDEWRAIGFAPRKDNQKLYDRYRKACDAFFAAKSGFYKESKGVLNENLEKKKALCEKAEALKDSTEWKETSDKLIQLQKEWKTIGPVPKKYSDEIWKKFVVACDYFFELKNKSTSGQRNLETENLTKKKELIEKINSLEVGANSADTLAELRQLIADFNNIGYVPFKEKDKIHKAYRTVVDKQFDVLNVDASQRRLDNFKHNLKDMAGKGENKLYHEREKLVRAYEHLKSEIATYENNIGFFTSTSKKGGGLIKEMERKIESLKEESKLIEQKISLIDQNL